MSLHKKTIKQLEEIYQRNIHCNDSFSKKESPELYCMCKHCEQYSGAEHDYKECRHMQCFTNWLALEYLDWVNSY